MAPTPYLLGVQKRLLDLVDDQGDVSYQEEDELKSRKSFQTRSSHPLLKSTIDKDDVIRL